MSGPKLIVQPDDGEKPVVHFLKSARKTVTLKQYTFTHPLLLDTVITLHKKGVRVRVMLNGAKMTGERLKYLERLRGLATITWRNDELKKAYEQALAVRQRTLAG